MKKEDIAAFNRKIVNSNPTELICVLYEIYFTYETEAVESLFAMQQEDYVDAIRHCGQVVEHLRSILNFEYPISTNLYALYTYVERKLAKAMYKKSEQEIREAGKVMKELQEAFVQVAYEDHRKPLMKNTQQVTVGLTYGKNNLNEAIATDVETRGFWA